MGQGLGAARCTLFDGALNLQNLRAIEIGGEHVARPVHEVVGFIDEEAVCAAILGEVTTQINLRVENVIVIADDGVGPHGDV